MAKKHNRPKKVKATPQGEQPPLEFSSEALLDALFFFWDGFERANLNFFLVRDTLEQVVNGEDLHGDALSLGLRKLEWNGGGEGVFRAFMEHEKVLPVGKAENYILARYKDVPVFLYLYEDNPCITGLDIVFYKYETFNIPNPWKTFRERYEL